MRSFTGIAGLIFGCCIISFFTVSAQGLYPVSTEQKIVNSTLIVEGKVIAKKSEWNAKHTMIYTTNTVEVYKVFKGSLQKNVVEIITIGGAVEGHAIQATHLLELNKSDIGVFFLKPQEKNNVPSAFTSALDVYSSKQGFLKYDIGTRTARAPFVEYPDIERSLYKELQTKTGRGAEIKNSSFSLEKKSGPFQSNNSTLAPVISNYAPTTVTAGTLLDPANNILTINGSGFGTKSGDAAVLFTDADMAAGNFITVENTSPLIIAWSATQIRIRVPTGAGTGPIRVVDNVGNFITTSTALNVLYSVLTADFGGSYGLKQFTLGNMNNSGGYSVKYSSAVTNSGVNINTSPAKATFQRALNTWKETVGVNFAEAGTTTLQTVNPDDGENIIEYDNGGTGMPRLADGVLATCFSGVTICTNDPANNQARKTGFDIVIRNTGYSSGTTPFTLGPCPPLSEASNVVDLETVLLHELGHALNLGHIVDPLVGSGAGTASPGKVMHFSIAYNQRRISLDYASKTGGLYLVTPHGYTFGNCVVGEPEMSPVATVLEPKDECPTPFPVSSIPTLTKVSFDLAHSTSNKFGDPAHNQWKTDGGGSNVTNTAYYAFKTNETGGNLVLEVSNYTTSPAAVAECPIGGSGVTASGVKLSLYKVSACPTGGAFPTPVEYQVFTQNMTLETITGLTPSSTYLVAVDGLQNTKALFDLTFSGSALPTQSTELTGLIVGELNQLNWTTDPSFDVFTMVLERSDDGVTYEDIKEIIDEQQQLAGQYSDADPLPGLNYYRMRVQSTSGSIQYSGVVTLNRADSSFAVFAPNPLTTVDLPLKIVSGSSSGTYYATIYNVLGQQVFTKRFAVSSRSHIERLNTGSLMRGTYFVTVFGEDGKKVKSVKIQRM